MMNCVSFRVRWGVGHQAYAILQPGLENELVLKPASYEP